MAQQECGARTGQAVTPLLRHSKGIVGVTFDSVGGRVATCSDDCTARIWNAATGEALTPPLQHAKNVQIRPCSSGDGNSCYWKRLTEPLKVRDSQTGRQIGAPLQHDATVRLAIFSPDSACIATACYNGTIRLWDFRAGIPVCPAHETPGLC